MRVTLIVALPLAAFSATLNAADENCSLPAFGATSVIATVAAAPPSET